MQLGRLADRRTCAAGTFSLRLTASARSATSARWCASSESRSSSALSRTSAVCCCPLGRFRCLWRYMRSSAMRKASVSAEASAGISTAPYEQLTAKPSPSSVSASAARSITLPEPARSSRRDAELVAAEAIRGTEGSRRKSQTAGDAAQPGVARSVAERVVVGLEAVQVEDDERSRVRSGECAPRSAKNRLRFPRPVSGSVSASSRLAANRATRSRNVRAARTITAAIVAAERTTAKVLIRTKWSYTSTTSPAPANTVRTAMPPSCRRVRPRACGSAARRSRR